MHVFRHDQAREGDDRRAHDMMGPEPDHVVQHVLHRAALGFDAGHIERAAAAFEKGGEQILLRFDKLIERPLRHPGLGGNVVHRRGVIAFPQEYPLSRFDQRVPPLSRRIGGIAPAADFRDNVHRSVPR